MNPDETKKHSFKIIFSETLMFLAVVITVIILALLVSGYWLNSNFEVERNGMLQISSFPTGADIEIDGKTSSWLERTNSSKILSSGEHSVMLSKDGYDTWSKVVKVSEGLLYRLHYPRLFLNERVSSPITNTEKYTSATVSPNRNSLVLMNNTLRWGYLNLDSDEPKITPIDIPVLFSNSNQTESIPGDNTETSTTTSESKNPDSFIGKILQADWDFDSSHILFKVQNNETVEWILLDINDPKKSINLTREFGADFSRVEILDNNSNTLLAVRNNNLHRIDVPGRLVSAVLVENIFDFDHFRNEIIYSTTDNRVGYLKLGDAKSTELLKTNSPAKVAISRFYDDKYYTVLDEQTASIIKQDDADEEPLQYDFSFGPNRIKVGQDGEFLLFTNGKQIATLDMESKQMREWTIENDYGWIDNNMLYTINDGALIVYDFDGYNRRTIAQDVTSGFPVTITNDKWLYYFKNNTLMRDIIAK